MKVALVGPTYPFRGGIAHYTSLMATHLARRHETRVYGFRRLYPDRFFPGRSQLDPSESPLAAVDVRRWLTPWWPPSWRRVAHDWSSWRPDVAVIQWWVPFMAPMTAWLIRSARRADVRTALVCHNVLPHERSRVDAFLARAALNRADRLIVHGESERTKALTLLPGMPVQVVQLPSYADVATSSWTQPTARAALDVRGRMMLFFGFVRPYKGLLDLLNAMPDVLREIDVTLWVVGEIWGKPSVYFDRVKALGLEQRVRFVDRYVTNDEAALYLAAADLVVLPYREATGSAVLQLAFGLGVPVVATRTGGMAEAVADGVTGFLVAPGDAAGLGRAIVRFFQDGRSADMRGALAQGDPDTTWERLIAATVQ